MQPHDLDPIPEIRLVLEHESIRAKELVNGDRYGELGDGHKLGGNPDWIQDDETPACPECGELMDFYGQLDHLGQLESLLDDGMIYVFLCRECHTTAAVLQSH